MEVSYSGKTHLIEFNLIPKSGQAFLFQRWKLDLVSSSSFNSLLHCQVHEPPENLGNLIVSPFPLRIASIAHVWIGLNVILRLGFQ